MANKRCRWARKMVQQVKVPAAKTDYFNSRKNQKKRTDMKEWRGITGVQGTVKIGVNIIKMHCMHMKISKK